MESLDYRLASDYKRIHSIFPDDPVGDYFNFPECQESILEEEEKIRLQGRVALAQCEKARHLQREKMAIISRANFTAQITLVEDALANN